MSWIRRGDRLQMLEQIRAAHEGHEGCTKGFLRDLREPFMTFV
jgi:hypothetical protein